MLVNFVPQIVQNENLLGAFAKLAQQDQERLAKEFFLALAPAEQERYWSDFVQFAEKEAQAFNFEKKDGDEKKETGEKEVEEKAAQQPQSEQQQPSVGGKSESLEPRKPRRRRRRNALPPPPPLAGDTDAEEQEGKDQQQQQEAKQVVQKDADVATAEFLAALEGLKEKASTFASVPNLLDSSTRAELDALLDATVAGVTKVTASEPTPGLKKEKGKILGTDLELPMRILRKTKQVVSRRARRTHNKLRYQQASGDIDGISKADASSTVR